ncbi:MAG: aminotransferase class I/II-fold pyridoxal phosphate-dependent enzyme [Opitutales bacterium]|nr:aminotransferase class I/II-fold pyridoxal phosphate-dependent enzyme [Opitutales bacterium]
MSPQAGCQLHARHQERAATLKQRLTRLGLPVMHESVSHIVPIHVGEAALCKRASDRLMDHGIYVQPINYPTVPVGTERLRITPSLEHGDKEMDHLVEALLDVWHTLPLPKRFHVGDQE